MLDSSVQHLQWIWAALTAGVGLAALIVLWYLALWRERGPTVSDREPMGGPVAPWIVGYFPWVLILSFVGVTLFGIVYTVRSMLQTPNW